MGRRFLSAFHFGNSYNKEMAWSKDALRSLIALQEKDAAADLIQKDMDAIPPKIAAVKADFENGKKHLDVAKAHTQEIEKKKKAKELDVASKEESARKHAGQLNEVKSNDAYKALQVEIDKEKKAAGDIETEILVLMDEIDKARQEEKAAAVEVKKIEDFAKKDIEKMEAELSHAKGRLDAAKAERETATAGIPPEVMKIYNHIRTRGKLDAVVAIVDGHCGACQINLTPSIISDATKCKAMISCESCQRILYKSEVVAVV